MQFILISSISNTFCSIYSSDLLYIIMQYRPTYLLLTVVPCQISYMISG